MDLFLAGCQGVGLALAAGALAGAPGRRGTLGTVLALLAAIVGGAALFGISLAAEDHPAWPGWPVGAALAAFAFFVVRDLAEGAARRAEGGGFIGALIALAALALAGLSVLVPPVSLVALAGLLWLYRRPAPARGAEVRGAEDAAVTRAQARPLRRRLAAHRHAPRGGARRRGADLRRPARARHADRRLRLLVPLRDPGLQLRDRHRRAPGSSLDQRQQLVSPRRGPLRRVRQLVRGDARVRALPDALRHRLQHEHVPPLRRGGDDLRAARRPRRAQRLHPVPDLPRPHPPRARARGAAAPGGARGQLPPRDLGSGRALLRRALLEPPGRLQADPGAAGHPRRVLGLRRARAGQRATSTTSCSSRCPTTTTTRTSSAPRRRSSRSPAPTPPSPSSPMPPAASTSSSPQTR